MAKTNMILGSPLRSITVAATSTLLFTLPTSHRCVAIVRKVMFFNHQAANVTLQIGYVTAAAAFTVVLPDILMLAGMGDTITADQLPIAGNNIFGFADDNTAVTGTTGDIYAQASAAAAAPNDIEVAIEVEIY